MIALFRSIGRKSNGNIDFPRFLLHLHLSQLEYLLEGRSTAPNAEDRYSGPSHCSPAASDSVNGNIPPRGIVGACDESTDPVGDATPEEPPG